MGRARKNQRDAIRRARKRRRLLVDEDTGGNRMDAPPRNSNKASRGADLALEERGCPQQLPRPQPKAREEVHGVDPRLRGPPQGQLPTQIDRTSSDGGGRTPEAKESDREGAANANGGEDTVEGVHAGAVACKTASEIEIERLRLKNRRRKE
eukprot:CAMPEP_0194329990 /NCGR_PEP_ID=MMETSP0171-20130528/50114_1 /TAXON_ID=218684 /ORGANISM="Corethron pennatum, Strain L29A3" /LENGTH=151 /DNA_ID=CAMNT_0039090897 /DNA_START=112 /DNA_END=564 /DNA_ORIENTATION=-